MSNSCNYPEVTHDLEFFQQRKLFRKDLSCYCGSREKDICCEVSGRAFEPLKKASTFFDGTKNSGEIANLLIDANINTDVNMLVEKFAELGLLENSGLTPIPSEAEISMLDLVAYRPKNQLRGSFRRIALFTFRAVFLFSIFSLVISIFFAFTESPISSTSINLPIYLLAFILSYLFHEVMHVLAAIGSGIKISAIKIALYFNLIPMLYIQYRNIYFCSAKARVFVSLAGISGNILISCSSFIFFHIIGESSFLYSLILANQLIIASCLLPFKLSDGYFILSEIIGSHNLRRIIILQIVGEKSSHINSLSPKMIAYFFLAIVYASIAIYLSVNSFIGMLLNSDTILEILIVVFAISTLVMLVIRVLQNVRKIRAIRRIERSADD